jgi:hypothetical protein
LGGCLVVADKRIGIGIQARVEVIFRLRCLVFRLAGVTASTRNAHAFAIRFLQVPHQRQQELAAAIDEEIACNTAPKAIEPTKPADDKLVLPASATIATGLKLVTPAPSRSAKDELLETCAAIVRSTAASSLERRSSSRHSVDTRANLLLIKTGITMPGRILNLSLGGCQIRMEERFNVGIYVRVEAEFFLHGLPFRVGGVSQAIVDKFTIGIRFLDMSERRRLQLSELIEEIAEAKAKGFDPTAIVRTPDQESQ